MEGGISGSPRVLLPQTMIDMTAGPNAGYWVRYHLTLWIVPFVAPHFARFSDKLLVNDTYNTYKRKYTIVQICKRDSENCYKLGK